MTTAVSGAALLRAGLFASLGFLAAFPAPSSAEGLAHRRLRLPNGLTVVVHEDHKAPIVSLAVWYRVGSADEPAGRTGFAHLFEHLMFRGSKHHNAPFLRAIEDIGGTADATTWFDHTAYEVTVPTGALDKALWLESDRMGYLLDPLDEAGLDAERGVVRNELQEMLGRPYGRSQAHLFRHLFPANHPYHHDPFGKATDLEGATLDDVRDWFRKHYGAANATVVMAGDITLDVAREKALAYFGDLPPGPDLVRRRPWFAPLRAASSATMHDYVPARRIVRAWPIPQEGNAPAASLRLAARILAGGAESRLYARLVTNDRLASNVEADVLPLAAAGVFVLAVDVAEGADVAAVETALDDEVRRFLAHGTDDDELALAKTRETVAFLAETERMKARADRLANGQTWFGDPTTQWVIRQSMAEAGAEWVRTEAATWLTQPSHTLTILPAPEAFDAEAEDAADVGLGPAEGEPAPDLLSTAAFHATPDWAIDRRVAPGVVAGPMGMVFPPVQRSQLGTGATFVSARRSGSAFVHVRFLFGGGSAGDHGRLAGTASFTLAMIEEAAAAKANRLGATVETDCEADACTVDLRVPREDWQAGLAVMVDAIRQDASQGDMEGMRQRFLAAADPETKDPSSLARELTTRLLYGNGHPYGVAAFGNGTRESLLAMDAEALAAYRRDYLRPDNLSVVMVGDVSHDDGARLLDGALAAWVRPDTPVPSLPTHASEHGQGDVAYLFDRPGARQAHIAVGLLAPPAGEGLDLELAVRALAGATSSRLNTNLRESKGWSYGVMSHVSRARGERALTVQAAVQADVAGDAVGEIHREMAALADRSRPLSDAEVANVRNKLAGMLSTELESDRAWMINLSTAVKLGRRDDFFQHLPSRLRDTHAANVSGALEDLLRSRRRTWVFVGDRALIEIKLRQQFPGLRIIDAQGAIVE